MFEYAQAAHAGHASPALTSRPSAVSASETRGTNRIVVLDILRGIALLGMFFVHFNMYEATPLGAEPGPVAAFLERVLGLFFDERFYAIFGMLFGVGFAVQLERADARGEPFLGRYLRRLAALAVFGFIAEGIFGYNVLFGYAMWGVPLILVRRWPVKALVVLVILCAAARPIWSVTRIAIASAQPGGIARFNAQERDEALAFQAARDSLQAASQSGSWRTVVAARLAHMPKFHRRWSVLPSGSFTLFLLGLIGWKLGVFTRPAERKRLILALTVAGLVSSAVATFALPFGSFTPPSPDSLTVTTAIIVFARRGFNVIREQWLAFTYIGVVLLLVASNPAWYRRLAAFAWTGRMALTNYMTQVILLDVLFTPHGFGMKIPALLVFPAAIILFVAQAYFSRWWLSRFRQGPLEWVWRMATTWAWQPLRVEQPGMTPPLAA
jgi:uncharacterized protein